MYLQRIHSETDTQTRTLVVHLMRERSYTNGPHTLLRGRPIWVVLENFFMISDGCRWSMIWNAKDMAGCDRHDSGYDLSQWDLHGFRWILEVSQRYP